MRYQFVNRQPTPEPVYAYDESKNDFRIFPSKLDWENNITLCGVMSYLEKHLQKSLIDDFYPAYEVYKSRGVGFFALPRMVFPYISFLGTLIVGTDLSESANAAAYMNKYMSKVNRSYSDKQLCDFIYRVYRHGLAHTNMPKVVSDGGKTFGWRIIYDDKQHLTVDNNLGILGKSGLLIISPKKLAEEVVHSIDEYIKDLKSGMASFGSFKKGFLSMATTSHYVNRQRTIRIPIPQILKQ